MGKNRYLKLYSCNPLRKSNQIRKNFQPIGNPPTFSSEIFCIWIFCFSYTNLDACKFLVFPTQYASQVGKFYPVLSVPSLVQPGQKRMHCIQQGWKSLFKSPSLSVILHSPSGVPVWPVASRVAICVGRHQISCWSSWTVQYWSALYRYLTTACGRKLLVVECDTHLYGIVGSGTGF